MLEPCAKVIVSNRQRRQKNVFSKILDKVSFYPQHFLMTFFSHRKLQQNKYTATMALARRQIIGAPINKSRRRRRPQIVGGDAAGALL